MHQYVLAEMEPHINVEMVLYSLEDRYNVHLRCILCIGTLTQQYV